MSSHRKAEPQNEPKKASSCCIGLAAPKGGIPSPLITLCAAAMLETTDVDNTAAQLTYTVTAVAGNGLTVSAWIRVDNFNKARQTLLGKGLSDNYRINRTGTTNRIRYSGAGSGSHIESAVNVNDGQWHHVVAVTEISGTATRFYVDGSTNVVTTSGQPGLADNDLNLLIGNNPEATDRGWNGMIDDVAIWGRPLTEAIT